MKLPGLDIGRFETGFAIVDEHLAHADKQLARQAQSRHHAEAHVVCNRRMNDMQRVAVDPFSTEFLIDPYSGFDLMRNAGEAVWLDQYQACAVTRHAQVQSMLIDTHQLISHSFGHHDSSPSNPSWPRKSPRDGDFASDVRACAAVTAVLSQPVLNRLYHQFSAEAEKLVEHLTGRGSFDAIADVAQAFSLKVISDAVGLTDSRRENLVLYTDRAFSALGPRNQPSLHLPESTEGAFNWMNAQTQLAALKPGGLGAAIYAQADEGVCTAAESGLAVRSLLAAGVAITVNAIGNGISSFVRHPAQWRHLHADPSLAQAAIEESLRYESPVQTFYQTSARDISFGKTRLPQGSLIFLFLGGANRDRRRWDRAEQFDIRRNTTGHVSFGTGMLACVGQRITKLAGEVLFAALARRITGWEFNGDPILHLGNTIRGWSSLPVKVSLTTPKLRSALRGLPGRVQTTN